MARAIPTLAVFAFLLGACSGAPVPPIDAVSPAGAVADVFDVEPAAGHMPTALETLPWPQAESCPALVERVLALDAASTRRLDRRSAPLALLALAQSPGGPGNDLVLPRLDTVRAVAPPCVVILGDFTTLTPAADVELERRTVHSSYRTGTKRRRNPEHQALERELASARREADSAPGVLSTGDPLVDLIGMVAGTVISGFDAVTKRQELQVLEARLDAADAFIEDPILTPYRYEHVEVEAQRRFAVPVALHDGTVGELWQTVLTLSETERFAIVDGRHPKDAEAETSPGTTARLATSAELALWRRRPPPVDDRALLTHLAGATRSKATQAPSLDLAVGAMRTPDLPAMNLPAMIVPASSSAESPDIASRPVASPLLAGPAPTAPGRDGGGAMPEPAAGDPSPGRIRPLAGNLARVGDDDMPGFYVSAEHMVVPAAALGRSSLVTVRYADGLRAHGLVELVDDELGLALIYLPRPAEPLPLATGGGLPPTSEGENGVPWGTNEAVFGVFVDDPSTSGGRWIDGATLQRLVSRLDQL